MIIRLAHPTDAAQLVILNGAFNDPAAGPQQVAGYLAGSPDERTVVAEIDGLPAGFACLRIFRSWCYADPWAELTELFVAPEQRRGELGRAMVDFAEQLARDAGAAEMLVHAGMHNAAGQSFYRSCGYRGQSQLAFRKALR